MFEPRTWVPKKLKQFELYRPVVCPETDIDEMIRESEVYRAEDQRRREIAEAKNQLDGLVYNTARSFDEFGDQLAKEDSDELRAALEMPKKPWTPPTWSSSKKPTIFCLKPLNLSPMPSMVDFGRRLTT